jgi:uncharacterized protein YndB with AHSA1/START domain
MTAPATHGSFTIERIFDAKPERVFKAFSDLEAKSRWFAGPGDWELRERVFDFRVGGTEIVAGRWPNGMVTRFTCRYEDIVPNSRIIYSYHMHLDDRHISVSLATVEIAPDGARTKLTFTEHATFVNGYEDPGAKSRHEGSIGLIDRLGASLVD